MKNLLVGNGINIQFSKNDYTTQQIVLRILKNFDREDFPLKIIIDTPYLMRNYLGVLFLEVRNIIDGKYDKLTVCDDEWESLKAFKKRYKNRLKTLKMTDVGFEDYYLIHDLMCHKLNVQNPEQYNIRESMRLSFLYSIYNDGALNQLYNKYPVKFVDYLKQFNNIFTTNYDSNIESATGMIVFHLHGQFDKKRDIYIESSFRNQLPDKPIKNIIIDDNFFYLYSNALSTHCGAYKEFLIKESVSANSCISAFAEVYKTDAKAKEDIDNWINDKNHLVANLGAAIKIKAQNPTWAFSEDYHFDKFCSITGTLDILGLSPCNDFHIFESIDQSKISKCVYYYFNESECGKISELLPILKRKNMIEFKPVIGFWRDIAEK